jgi:hypothetical protein
MSSISEKYGQASQTVMSPHGGGQGVPQWIVDPNNVPFSRKNTPDLYAAQLAILQKAIADMRKKLKSDRTIGSRMKDAFDDAFLLEENQDTIYAALEPHERTEIECDLNSMIIEAQMKSLKWDAYNFKVSNLETARQVHMKLLYSRNRRNDIHNERLIQKEIANTSVNRQEVKQTLISEAVKQGGMFGFLRGGK